MIARQLNEVGADVPERTVARRGAEWREEQERRERVRDQVQAMVGAMKDHDLSSAEMLQALAIDALMSDPEAWAQADPVKVQRQNLQAETLRLKRDKLQLERERHELDVARFKAMQDREQRAIAAAEDATAKARKGEQLTVEDLNRIRDVYGLAPVEASKN